MAFCDRSIQVLIHCINHQHSPTSDVLKPQGQNLKAKASTVEALAWTFEAKAIGHEAFKHCRYSRN